jgi:hypothetical protein
MVSAVSYQVARILIAKPVPTFAEYALAASAVHMSLTRVNAP